jgi:2,3-dihydroxybenzoate decarboxylase
MHNRIALEEHLSAEENNKLWDSAGESARNGKTYTDYIESHLLDVDDGSRPWTPPEQSGRSCP